MEFNINEFEKLVDKVRKNSVDNTNKAYCHWVESQRGMIRELLGVELDDRQEQYHKGCVFIKLPDGVR